MIFRIRYHLLGGHYHCRLFAGRSEGKLGKCGDLVMRKEEFELFRKATESTHEEEAIRFEFKKEEIPE